MRARKDIDVKARDIILSIAMLLNTFCPFPKRSLTIQALARSSRKSIIY